MKAHDFSEYLTNFLVIYLPDMKGVSKNTISSYCDTFRLFLTYCRDNESVKIENLNLSDFTSDLVEHFLEHITEKRNVSPSTRNQRLAAIHSFVRYIQAEEPTHLLEFKKILDIPNKSKIQKVVNYLSKEDVTAILSCPDMSTISGRRDVTMLSLLYDTGARVQEICDLKVQDIRFGEPCHVKLMGKGQKQRLVPVLPNTAELLKSYLHENNLVDNEYQPHQLFTNRMGEKLTRAGISYILNKYVSEASGNSQSIPKSISPHIMRHTKAMHIYEAGAPIIYVRDILGHTDVKTTNVYARTSIQMKRKAMEKVSDSPTGALPAWNNDPSLLGWLKSYGKTNK